MANRLENSGNSDRLYFLGSKITADGDCTHQIKRHLLLGRKAITNLDSILKSRDITLPTKVHLVKAMVFLGEGNGNLFQCLCLEKPMDGGAWQATVHEVTELDMTEHIHTLEEKNKILEKRKIFIFFKF